MVAFFDFLIAVGHAIWGVWTLDPATLTWLEGRPDSFSIAFTIAVLAGVSTLLGDSVVLFLNRVRGLRFVFSLLLNGLAMVALYLVQAVVIALLGDWMLGTPPVAPFLIRGVMLSTAPLLFGVLALVPYFGPAIARILQAWGVVALWMIVQGLYDVDVLPALWVTLAGWGVMQLMSWALARPVTFIGSKIFSLISGQPFMLTGRDLLSGHPFMPLGQQVEGQEAGR